MAVLEMKMSNGYPNRVTATNERASDLKAEPWNVLNLETGRGSENWISGIHRA